MKNSHLQSPSPSENDRPNVFDKIILVNCKEQDRQDIVKKDIVTQMLRPNGKKYERADIDRSTILKINQYEYFPVAFKEVLLGIDLQFLLYIIFRSSPFIDEPKGISFFLGLYLFINNSCISILYDLLLLFF